MHFKFIALLVCIGAVPLANAQTMVQSQRAAETSVINSNAPNSIISLSQAAAPEANPSASPASQAAAGAKQGQPKVGAIESEDIAILDGKGKPIDEAKGKLAAAKSEKARTSMLLRISSIDGQTKAVIWYKGTTHRVSVGSPVAKYVVSEIRDSEVCLDKPGTKAVCVFPVSF